MAGFWEVLTPVAGKNLITNPTPYIDLTGYTISSSTRVRDATRTRRGIASVAVTPTSSIPAGIYWLITLLPNTTYVLSTDFWGVAGDNYRLAVFDVTAASYLAGNTFFTGTGYWLPNRPYFSFTTSANTSYRLYVQKYDSANTDTFWIDGFQLELGSVPSTYMDGAQNGCTWDGAPWASTTTRSAQCRDGGVLTNFDTLGMGIDKIDGVGMPPPQNVLLRYGLVDGAYYQRTKQQPRKLSLTMHINTGIPTSLAQYHIYRKALIDAVEPDLTSPQTPFWLRYSGLGSLRPLWLRAIYDDGLQISYGSQKGFVEEGVMSLVNDDPYWYEDGVSAVSINGSSSLANANAILMRDHGLWAAMGTGCGGSAPTVYCSIIGPDGKIYVGGLFPSMGGVANTLNIAVYDPVAATWAALGTGCNDGVYALAFDALGNLYAGGAFTLAGGVANTSKVAKWNGAAWSALSTGGNGNVTSLCIGPAGELYAGGYFTTIGGSGITYLAKWNGSTWSAPNGVLAAMDNAVFGLAQDGSYLYIGGQFSSGGSVPGAKGIVSFNFASATYVSMGITGLNTPTDWVWSLYVASDGSVYAGGNFTTITGITCNSIARWNGNAWYALGTGLGGWASGKADVFCIAEDKTGIIYVGGVINAAGGLSITGNLTAWNGSSWFYVNAIIPSIQTAFVYSLTIDNIRDRLIVGFNKIGTATVASSVSIGNQGTATSYPTFIFTAGSGPSPVYQIQNYTTKTAIYFNLALIPGETAVLTLDPINVTFISSFRGNILNAILPGSNQTTFTLLPNSNSGNTNLLIILATMGTGSISVQWNNRFQSIDGGVT